MYLHPLADLRTGSGTALCKKVKGPHPSLHLWKREKEARQATLWVEDRPLTAMGHSQCSLQGCKKSYNHYLPVQVAFISQKQPCYTLAFSLYISPPCVGFAFFILHVQLYTFTKNSRSRWSMKNPLIPCYPTVFQFPFCACAFVLNSSQSPATFSSQNCLVALRVLIQLTASCWASTSLPPFIYCYTSKSHITVFSSTFWVSQMLSGPANDEFPPLVPTICF